MPGRTLMLRIIGRKFILFDKVAKRYSTPPHNFLIGISNDQNPPVLKFGKRNDDLW